MILHGCRPMHIGLSLKLLCFLLVGFSTLSSSINAEEWNEKLLINGFFTFDLTQSDDDITLISNSDQALTYQENKPSLRNSLIGSQLSYQISDNLEAGLQAKLYVNSADDITGTLDWSYLSYDLGDDLRLRAGKFQIPFMQGIELRNISYSRLWARPLIPSSGAGGFNEFVGAELLKHVSVGSANWDIQLSAGKAKHGLSAIDNKNIALVSVRYQKDNFWLRGALLNAQYRFVTRNGRVLTDSGDAIMASIETEYSNDNFVINAGYSTSRTDISPNDTAYYLSLGYYLGDVIPFVALSRMNQHFDLVELPAPTMTQNPPRRPPQGPPPAFPLGDFDVFSEAIGLKYNFSAQYALKVQLEHVKSKDDAGIRNGSSSNGNSLSVVFEGVF